MSNDTKREVFGQLLNAYHNLMMKGIEIPDENYRENITTPWNIVYDAAFPDDLPVIPRAVADWIEHCKNRNYSLWVALFDFQGDSKIDRWFNDNGLRSIRTQRQDIFARAWLDGYTVEED